MADVTVTNSTMVTNTITTITDNPATADVADLAQAFVITPTKADYKVIIEFDNGPTNGSVTYSIAAGEYWASKSPLTGSVTQATKRGIVLEGAKYKSKAGTITITVTPASTKKLLTDHAFKMRVVQMP